MIPFVAVIPARHASTRLPGKPLADIGGKPMVVRVAERARASGAREVWIATDHPDIESAARSHGFDACLTRPGHPSGTDRIAEVAALREWPDETLVVNVQGDEPFIDPALVAGVARRLAEEPDAAMASACHRLHALADLMNPNVVKVALDGRGRALYFSRAPIPWARDAFAAPSPSWPEGYEAFRHIGIYAYRAGFLARYAQLEPSPLERFESLEQLRVLWHGERIAMLTVEAEAAPGIDTPEDLERARRRFDRAGE